MGLCVLSLSIPLVMIERIYTLSYYHHKIGCMNYYPLFMVRWWKNGMRCMSLSILTNDLSYLLKIYDYITLLPHNSQFRTGMINQRKMHASASNIILRESQNLYHRRRLVPVVTCVWDTQVVGYLLAMPKVLMKKSYCNAANCHVAHH